MRTRLHLERLDGRLVPANLIPGWTGDEQAIQGHFGGGPLADKAVVAEGGGSCRVMVFGPDGSLLLNTIAFDPSFRGGGHLAAIGSIAGNGVDSLLVVPGAGGPNVLQFDFNSQSGHLEETASFYAPFPESFRGGLQVSSAVLAIDGKETPIALFLPGEGGGPEEVGVDLQTRQTIFSIDVGNPDVQGLAGFEPTGGAVYGPGDQVGLVVQYGPVVDDSVPTKIWSPSGVDLTNEYVSAVPVG